jgi:cation diffusion facilitator family transporter
MEKEQVALSSVWAGLFLTVFKLGVGFFTGSIGIISEGFHSGLDFVTAFITFVAVKISGKPADKTHSYGHGKVESLSSLIGVVLLFATSIWIIYEAYERLVGKGVAVSVEWYSYAIVLISIIIDINRSKSLYKVAKETNSQALESDALHFHSDIYSSITVFIGLIFLQLGITWADSLAAIIVAFVVIHAAFELGKRTLDGLLDTAPIGLTDDLKKKILNIDEVLNIGRIRIRPVGPTMYVDMIAYASRKNSSEQTEKIRKKIVSEIKKIVPNVDVTIDMKPISVNSESLMERVQMIANNHDVAIHDVSAYEVEGQTFLNFDLEVNQDLTLKTAHLKADHIEKTIKSEFPNVFVNIHIEPFRDEIIPASRISKDELKKIQKFSKKILAKIDGLEDIHEINGYKIGSNIFVNFHCTFSRDINIEKVHKLSSRIEDDLRKEFSNIEKVMIHVEPK